MTVDSDLHERSWRVIERLKPRNFDEVFLNTLAEYIMDEMVALRAEAKVEQDIAIAAAIKEYQEEVHDAYAGAIAEAKVKGAQEERERWMSLWLAANRPSPK